MKIQTKKRVTQSVLQALVCDKCHCRIAADDTLQMQESLSLEWTGGYAAVMGDMVTWSIDLCQACVRDVLGPYARRQDVVS